MIAHPVYHGVANDSPETTMDAALRELFHHDDRVPFVYWREYTGTDTTVPLTGAVAVLAFVTGLSHFSQSDLAFDGPLAPVLPAGSATVIPFGAVLLAFVLGGLAVGLRRRLRIAWYGTTLMLPLVVVLPLVTAEPTDVLLFVLSFGTLPLVVRNRAAFDQSLDLSPFQTAAIVAFVAGQAYGTVGAYRLRGNYAGIETWTDALYYIVVTGTTVGYGDATPTSQGAKLFTLSAIVISTGTFAVASGSLIIPAIESRVSAAFGTMTPSELTLMEDHVVVLGYGDLIEPLVDELVATTDVVVVTPDTDTASALGEDDVNVLTADPTDEDALLDARIDVANGVVAATDDDAQDTLAVLAAREVNPEVRIVAAATDHGHVSKLERVGADKVISPSVIVGRRLGQSVLGDAEASAVETATAETDDGDDDNGDTTEQS